MKRRDAGRWVFLMALLLPSVSYTHHVIGQAEVHAELESVIAQINTIRAYRNVNTPIKEIPHEPGRTPQDVYEIVVHLHNRVLRYAGGLEVNLEPLADANAARRHLSADSHPILVKVRSDLLKIKQAMEIPTFVVETERSPGIMPAENYHLAGKAIALLDTL